MAGGILKGPWWLTFTHTVSQYFNSWLDFTGAQNLNFQPKAYLQCQWHCQNVYCVRGTEGRGLVPRESPL